MNRKSVKTRNILGIDPGTNICGFAVLRQVGNRRELLELGTIKMPAKSTHPEKLKHLFMEVTALIKRCTLEECAVESPFFGKNVQSMLKLGRAQGVVMAAAIAQDLTVSEYAPKKIKMSVTGSGNASKEQVASMVSKQLNYDVSKFLLDATDAAATALCHLNQSGLAGTGKKYKDWKGFLSANSGRLRS